MASAVPAGYSGVAISTFRNGSDLCEKEEIYREGHAVISMSTVCSDPSEAVSEEEQEFRDLLNKFSCTNLHYLNLLVNNPDFSYVGVMQRRYAYSCLLEFVKEHPTFRERLPEFKEPEECKPKQEVDKKCPDDLYELLQASDRDMWKWIEPLAVQPYNDANKDRVLYLLRSRDRPNESRELFVNIARCSNPTLRAYLLLYQCHGRLLCPEDLVKYVHRVTRSVLECVIGGVVDSDNQNIDCSVLKAADKNAKANLLLMVNDIYSGLPEDAPSPLKERLANLKGSLLEALS
jgi:hypothetical protein